MTTPPFTLVKAADRTSWNAALADEHGGRVALSAVLSDLNRNAVHRIVPVSSAAYGFRWNRADMADPEWWPQGVTHSGDAGETDTVDGRRIVAVSWYAKPVGNAPSRGSRVSFVDITDPSAPRYRHVALVQSTRDEESGTLSWQPVRLHAGGIAWYGGLLFVSATRGGVWVFGLDDIVQVQSTVVPDLTLDAHEPQYVLPQRTAYSQVDIEGFETFRFSSVAVDRSGSQPRLDAGEYGQDAQTHRLASFVLADDGLALEPAAGETDPRAPLDTVESGVAANEGPLDDAESGVAANEGRLTVAAQVTPSLGHVQGVVTVKGTAYLSTSRGKLRRGTMWTRTDDGPFERHHATLAVGCEDLAYWPQRDQIWSVSEYPRRRFVYAMPRGAFHH